MDNVWNINGNVPTENAAKIFTSTHPAVADLIEIEAFCFGSGKALIKNENDSIQYLCVLKQVTGWLHNLYPVPFIQLLEKFHRAEGIIRSSAVNTHLDASETYVQLFALDLKSTKEPVEYSLSLNLFYEKFYFFIQNMMTTRMRDALANHCYEAVQVMNHFETCGIKLYVSMSDVSSHLNGLLDNLVVESRKEIDPVS